MHVYIWQSSFAVHLKLSLDCYLAISQYKIKKLKKKGMVNCIGIKETFILATKKYMNKYFKIYCVLKIKYKRIKGERWCHG